MTSEDIWKTILSEGNAMFTKHDLVQFAYTFAACLLALWSYNNVKF